MTHNKDRAPLRIAPEGDAPITSLAKAFSRLPREQTPKARPSTGSSLPAVGSLS
ncbi:hypothetical protein MCBMB27_02090 [Methylobacterium phyllosphaerae]|uniref:Uncharacterized protein n=1 Tax=Methylobacterium phyllosphaerae TaxID=418223 RepID=A0AAE8HQ37_9HYPH|nr:hypothetical protein MCBMB27_02090 [Methylobacterium phyllosphaerae]SFG64293.1 hypothetical protein SAMN05192567_10639 [Methylobacterium phyllosphaerae]